MKIAKLWLVALLTALFLPVAPAQLDPRLAVASTLAEPPTFLFKWGTGGSGDGQFLAPTGVAFDTSGNVYVSEEVGSRIQKFTSSGGFIAKWGSYGSADGQFMTPIGIAVDSSGGVYVADFWNNRIQKFSSSGTFVAKWGSGGAGDGQFSGPAHIAIDASDNVYVADYWNHRIQKFTSSGSFITKWGTYGTGNGQFNQPLGVAVDSSGDVFVADTYNHRIQKFTSSGSFIAKWGSFGTGDGQFDRPFGVAVDTSGNVYIAEDGNNRMQEFTSTGGFIAKWGSYGSADGQFKSPSGVAISTVGKVYVADQSNHRIQVFGNAANRPPTLGPITAPLDPVQVAVAISASANFSDPDVGDAHTAFWDWGDGSTSSGAVDEEAGSIASAHAYTTAGVYTVTLTLTDSCGASAQSVFRYIVVYDPSGGFVTGGGWINSPAGAYSADLTLTGKANFGFVSKYQKGTNVPTGNTEFQFKVANINFKSTSYEWLVVAGARAQYKGTGTINGSGDYGFMLTAIDGQQPGGGGTDKFRIKIWDKTTEVVIYDNQMGADDAALPSTAIGGGSIVIHKE